MTPPSFHHLVDEYLTVRRGLGFDLESPEWQLWNFASYADRIGHSGPLTIEHWPATPTAATRVVLHLSRSTSSAPSIRPDSRATPWRRRSAGSSSVWVGPVTGARATRAFTTCDIIPGPGLFRVDGSRWAGLGLDVALDSE